MMRNDGVYISASFSDFAKKGAAEIKALVLEQARLSPAAPVFLACGSAGGSICWRLVRDPEVKPLLGGLVFFDCAMDTGYLKLRRDSSAGGAGADSHQQQQGRHAPRLEVAIEILPGYEGRRSGLSDPVRPVHGRHPRTFAAG